MILEQHATFYVLLYYLKLLVVCFLYVFLYCIVIRCTLCLYVYIVVCYIFKWTLSGRYVPLEPVVCFIRVIIVVFIRAWCQ